MFNEIFGLQGNTDIEQLALVIRTLGTPSTADWPEVKNLPDYNKIRFVRPITIRSERYSSICFQKLPHCSDSFTKAQVCLEYNPLFILHFPLISLFNKTMKTKLQNHHHLQISEQQAGRMGEHFPELHNKRGNWTC